MGSITDVPRVLVGHWTTPDPQTGCTVLIFPGGASAGMDMRGATLGTRETDLVRAGQLVRRINAILLTGGSAYGLAAVQGAMRFLEERGEGFRIPQDLPTPGGGVRAEGSTVPHTVVPIIAAAAVFDLDVSRPRPGAEAGFAACEAATDQPVREGRVGAGAGALAGTALGRQHASPGGLGSAGSSFAGYAMGVLVVVNCFGCIVDPDTSQVLAGPTDARTGELVAAEPTLLDSAPPPVAGTNNLIAIVATDLPMTREQANELAGAAYNGFVHAVRPTSPGLDGSVIFAVSTAGAGAIQASGPVPPGAALAAADLVARATVRAVRASAHSSRPS